MASAAASRPPPPPPAAAAAPTAMQWLSPRVSFSLDDAGGGAGREAAVGAGSADFEFFLAGCSAVSMLPADELFSGGKLVPLRLPAEGAGVAAGAGVTAAAMTLPPLAPPVVAVAAAPPETPRTEVAEGAAQEPKVPVRRWRDLLRLRKQQASGAAASDPKPLRRLLRRGPKPPEPELSLSLPLLHESSSDGPDKPAPASAPAPAPTPTPPPPSSQQLPPKIRLLPAQATEPPPPPPPSPPTAVAADSPRLNAAGKVVFNGLGRSSSSPSSLASVRRHRSAGGGGSGIERSYSAHVRVAPVLNVPVCSLRGSRKSVSVFGIDRLFSPSSSAAAAAKKGKAAKKETPPAPAPPPPPPQ